MMQQRIKRTELVLCLNQTHDEKLCLNSQTHDERMVIYCIMTESTTSVY